MYCRKCGAENDDNAYKCEQCGAKLRSRDGESEPVEKIPNYLVQAIIVTLCCCLPLGIVAIVYAAQVNGLAQGGDYDAAREASRKANMWSWIAFGVGLTINVLYFGVVVLTEAVKNAP